MLWLQGMLNTLYRYNILSCHTQPLLEIKILDLIHNKTCIFPCLRRLGLPSYNVKIAVYYCVHQYTETDIIQLAHDNLVSELIVAISVRLNDKGFKFSATSAKVGHALVRLANMNGHVGSHDASLACIVAAVMAPMSRFKQLTSVLAEYCIKMLCST
jgi:hypothetical protein